MFPIRIARTILFLFVIASLVLAGCAPAATPAPAPVETEAPAPPVSTEAPAVEEPAAPVVEATEPPAPVETEAPPPAEPAEKKVATLIWTQEFDTLNSLYTNMWFVTAIYPIYACQGWWFDENNEPIPNLVSEIPSIENGGLSEDGRTITLKLRDDIKWSDGTPITSADFKFTYDMLMADVNAVASRAPFDLAESIDTPDERTVSVTFTDPYAPWLSRALRRDERSYHSSKAHR